MQTHIQPRHVLIRRDFRYIHVKLAEIRYIEARRDFVAMELVNGNQLFRSTIAEIIEKIGQYLFCQVHRSYIVNLDFVDIIEKNRTYIGEDEIPIQKKFAPDFMRRFWLLNK